MAMKKKMLLSPRTSDSTYGTVPVCMMHILYII
jgi:hypothetical protein